MTQEKDVEVEQAHDGAGNAGTGKVHQLSNLESGGQGDAPLKPTITQEHHDYLMKRHGTTDLHPIPDFSPNDPYNWPSWKKNVNLFLLSFHAMMTTLQAAAIIPAYLPLGESLRTSIQGASYLSSAQIIVLGFAPLFWKPLSHRFGRRPVWLISTLCSGLFNIGCAESKTYGAMMVCRVFSAFFIAPPIAIGSGVVVETFFAHQRGQKMGIWTLLVTLGPPVGPFIFGFVTQHAGWPWIYWVLAIVNFIQFFAYLAFGSETRYLRSKGPQTNEAKHNRVPLFKRVDPEPITFTEVIDPIVIGRHLTVLLPTISYAIVLSFASVLVTVEIPQTFIPTFGLDPQQLGLNFIAMIIGTIIGEQSAGPLSDAIMNRRAKALGHRPPPEHRLWLSHLGFIIVMVGLVVFGVQLQNATPMQWNVTPTVGAGIAAFGNQIVTTVLVTYAVDCHPDHGASVGGFTALVRQTWAFIGPFYFPPMFANLGYAGSLGLCVGIVFAVSVLPILFLQFAGRKVRRTPKE